MSAVAQVPGIDEQMALFQELARKAPESAVSAAVRTLAVAVEEEEKAPFVARALSALARVAEISTKRSLLEAASAQTDTLVLLQALDKPEVLAAMADEGDDPLVEARVRGALAMTWLLEEEGGTCSGDQLGQLLGGVSRQTVDNWRKKGKLLALDLGRRGYAYPVWQIRAGRVLPGFDQVLTELDGCDPWTQAGFMLNPNTWLGEGSPLAELRTGNLNRVLTAARMFVG